MRKLIAATAVVLLLCGCSAAQTEYLSVKEADSMYSWTERDLVEYIVDAYGPRDVLDVMYELGCGDYILEYARTLADD